MSIQGGTSVLHGTAKVVSARIVRLITSTSSEAGEVDVEYMEGEVVQLLDKYSPRPPLASFD